MQPLDLLPLLQELASTSRSLKELEVEARRAGLHAYYTVLRLPKRHAKLGARIHALVLHAGLAPEAIAVEGDGLEKSDLEELAAMLGLPVLAVRDGRIEVYASS